MLCVLYLTCTSYNKVLAYYPWLLRLSHKLCKCVTYANAKVI